LNPVISIVVATKSNLACLKQCVAAIQDFEQSSVELVVVDGSASDDTSNWLESIVPNGRSRSIAWVSVPDSSIAEAWNRGVPLARGSWVLFLGSDDRVIDAAAWHAAIEQLDCLPSECGVAAFPVRIVSPAGAILADERPCLGSRSNQFPAVNAIPHQGALHRRGLWEIHGEFDASFSIAADYEFLLRIWKTGVEIRACGGPPLVAMTFGGKSKRSLFVNVHEFRRARRLHNVRTSLLSECGEWGFAALRTAIATVLGETAARRLANRGRRIRGLPPVWDMP